FAHNSPYRTTAFQESPFYESLFADVNRQPLHIGTSEQVFHRRNGDGQLQMQPPVEESVRGLVPTLRRFLRAHLPEYMIPATFVMLDSLPVTPSGKLDRRALPVPGQGGPDLQGAYVAPRNETEQVLAGIWSELLGVERIGIDDNFFELGG